MQNLEWEKGNPYYHDEHSYIQSKSFLQKILIKAALEIIFPTWAAHTWVPYEMPFNSF